MDSVPRNFDWLPIVQSFQLGKLLLVTFNEIGEFVDESGSFKAGDVLSPGRLESQASRFDSNINISGRRLEIQN
jgi:hypothetical protein